MKDIKKNKKIVDDMNLQRQLNKERSSQEKITFEYSDKKSYINYNKRKKDQDRFSAYINSVDFEKKLPF